MVTLQDLGGRLTADSPFGGLPPRRYCAVLAGRLEVTERTGRIRPIF